MPTSMFERKGEKILNGDLEAGNKGYKIGEDILNLEKSKLK